MNEPKRISIWSGQDREYTNPDLNEAARQREIIRQQVSLEEQEKQERAKLKELMKKYIKV